MEEEDEEEEQQQNKSRYRRMFTYNLVLKKTAGRQASDEHTTT